MSNLGKVVAQLGKERQESQKKVEQLDQAWLHLATSVDYGNLVDVFRNQEQSGEPCLLQLARRLLRPNTPAGQNGKPREKPETRKKNAKQAEPSKWGGDYQPAAQRRA